MCIEKGGTRESGCVYERGAPLSFPGFVCCWMVCTNDLILITFMCFIDYRCRVYGWMDLQYTSQRRYRTYNIGGLSAGGEDDK